MPEYLKLINSLFGFTHREMEVLNIVFTYCYKLKFEGLKEMNAIDFRHYIMNETAINRHNLSNYMLKFERAGVLIKDKDTSIYSVKEEFFPVINDNSFDIVFKVSCLE